MKLFIVTILLVFAVSITDASAQSSERDRHIYYGGVFIDNNGAGIRTYDGGATWTELSSDEVKIYLDRQEVLLKAQATASVKPENEINVGVYPNPASSVVTVTSEELLQSDGHMRIFDLRGVEVLENKLVSGQSNRTIDISNLPAGQYRYVCTINGKSSNGGIVVQ